MPFQSGNKLGNRFNKEKQPEKKRGKGKLTSIVEELKELANKEIEGKAGKMTRKKALATVLFNKAINGDMKAIQLVVERLDGRTPEEIKHVLSGTVNNPMGGGATINIITNS